MKSRYGASSVEDCLYYDGEVNVWVELPPADKITSYNKFKNPKWYEEDNEIIEDTKPNIKNLNFIL